jgi:3-hexulose-6-phosphate synthase
MKLQLALDVIQLRDAKNLIEKVRETIDIVEVGTPFIIREGVGTVAKLKKLFPDLTFLADLKIIDGAEYESHIAFEAGADIVTVLGLSDNMTIGKALRKAEEFGKSIMVDMINVAAVAERAAELDSMGADYLCLHTAFDAKSIMGPPLEQLRQVKKIVGKAKIAVAGGINDTNAASIAGEKPDIVIVGSWVVENRDPLRATRILRDIISRGFA